MTATNAFLPAAIVCFVRTFLSNNSTTLLAISTLGGPVVS